MHFIHDPCSSDLGGKSWWRHRGHLSGPELGRVFGQGVKSECPIFSLPENQEDPSVTQLLVLIMLLCKYFEVSWFSRLALYHH